MAKRASPPIFVAFSVLTLLLLPPLPPPPIAPSQAHCPNGRIPALIDNSRKSLDGTDAPFSVFETGAILLYLAKFYDTDDAFGFKDPLERNECLQWIFFQHGGVGPMQGQLNHFNK